MRPARNDRLEIETGPVKSVPYQIPDKWKEPVRQELMTLRELGILVPTTSPWSSPIVPVPKKDGAVRVCVDFRRVNQVTVQDQYHIPEIVDQVGNSRFLSKLDLNKGFYQVRLSEQAQVKTAIVTPFGKFQMPFGLVNATSTFQRLMDRVLEGMQEFSSAYIDDILIYSPDWESHLEEAGLTAKVAKCEWAKTQLVYLGHRIGHGRVAVPEDRATAIAEFVKPTTKKGVRAFLGTSGYYRRFIPDFGKLAKPLTMLTRKAEPDQVHWTLEGEQAFNHIRELLCKSCALTIPTLSDDFRLHTDASGAGLGAVLSVVRSGEEYPVAYYSRQLQGAESNYSSTELECLAVVAAIRHFEVYLAGRRFELVTDHQTLKGLRTSRNHNRRLTRWSLFFSSPQDIDRGIRIKMQTVFPDSAGQKTRLQKKGRLQAKKRDVWQTATDMRMQQILQAAAPPPEGWNCYQS